MHIQVNELTSFIAQLQGLMFTKQPRAISFKTHWGIHTFFMNFPIDVLILDNNRRIATLKKKLPPWRVWIWNPKYNRVVELPEGTIEKLGLSVGMKVSI